MKQRAKRRGYFSVKVSYPLTMTEKTARTIVKAGTNFWQAKVVRQAKPVRIVR